MSTTGYGPKLKQTKILLNLEKVEHSKIGIPELLLLWFWIIEIGNCVMFIESYLHPILSLCRCKVVPKLLLITILELAPLSATQSCQSSSSRFLLSFPFGQGSKGDQPMRLFKKVLLHLNTEDGNCLNSAWIYTRMRKRKRKKGSIWREDLGNTVSHPTAQDCLRKHLSNLTTLCLLLIPKPHSHYNLVIFIPSFLKIEDTVGGIHE